jgi:hypothetical protein
MNSTYRLARTWHDLLRFLSAHDTGRRQSIKSARAQIALSSPPDLSQPDRLCSSYSLVLNYRVSSIHRLTHLLTSQFHQQDVRVNRPRFSACVFLGLHTLRHPLHHPRVHIGVMIEFPWVGFPGKRICASIALDTEVKDVRVFSIGRVITSWAC